MLVLSSVNERFGLRSPSPGHSSSVKTPLNRNKKAVWCSCWHYSERSLCL